MGERGSELVHLVDKGSAKSPFTPFFENESVVSVLKAAPLSMRGGQMAFVHKTVQLFEIFNVRFGACLVGPAASGKSSCSSVLGRALTALSDREKASSELFRKLHEKDTLHQLTLSHYTEEFEKMRTSLAEANTERSKAKSQLASKAEDLEETRLNSKYKIAPHSSRQSYTPPTR